MTIEERNKLINQLDYSFKKLPRWVKGAVKHSMGSPDKNPETGEYFNTFREVIECSSDETLESLKGDFKENGDLLEVPDKAAEGDTQYMILT